MKRIISIVLVCTAFLSAFFFPSSISVNAASTKAKAMKAYKEFMKTRDSKELFTIAYIDNNSVPELIVDRKPSNGTRFNGYGDLYTYKKGKIILVTNYLCTFGNWNANHTGGKFKYYKKTGIFLDDDSFQGCSVTGYHKLKNKDETRKASKMEYKEWTEITPATQYKIGDELTTKSKFKSYVKKLTKGKKLTKAKLYKNTKKNRNRILK